MRDKGSATCANHTRHMPKAQLSGKLTAYKQLQHQAKVANVLCSRAAVNPI
jgi:hypothetical protein